MTGALPHRALGRFISTYSSSVNVVDCESSWLACVASWALCSVLGVRYEMKRFQHVRQIPYPLDQSRDPTMYQAKNIDFHPDATMGTPPPFQTSSFLVIIYSVRRPLARSRLPVTFIVFFARDSHLL